VHETVGNSIQGARLKVLVQPDILIHHYKEDKDKTARQMNYLKIALDSIKENPNDARAHYTISSINNIYLKDYETALKHINTAYELGYEPEITLVGKAGILMQMRRFKEAFYTIKEALEKGFRDPLLYYYLGYIYSAKKNFVYARKAFEIFIRYDHPKRKEVVDV